MKILVPFLMASMLFVSNILSAQKQTITVTMEGISSNKGSVKFALYTEANFRLQPLLSVNGKITNGNTSIVFEDVTAGTYAIVCYHDKNDNNKMDFQPNGIPLEDYGASNNATTYDGPPTFDGSKFIVADKNINLAIRF